LAPVARARILKTPSWFSLAFVFLPNQNRLSPKLIVPSAEIENQKPVVNDIEPLSDDSVRARQHVGWNRLTILDF
jgi:hypothetical protein